MAIFVTAALLFPDHAKYIASREFNRESLGRRVRELFPLNFCRSTAQHPKECAKSKRKWANYFQRVQRSSDMMLARCISDRREPYRRVDVHVL